jgi:DNA-binding transcriptional ArsR family regulator
MSTNGANPNLEAALAYAEAGHPVFPLYGRNVPPPRAEDLEGDDPEAAELAYAHKKGKTPVGRPGFAPNGKDDATTDPDQITIWWTQRPQSGIGVRTDGLAVLDPDNAKGKARLAALEAEHSPLPATRTARTPGGGRHLVYATPGVEVGNGHKALGAPEDLHVRGGTAGYIAGAPSQTKLGRYKWQCGRGKYAKRIPPIADAPAWLIDLLTRNGDERPAAPPIQLPATTATPYGRKALDDEAAKVASTGKGARNNQLNESAFALGQLVAGGEIPAGEAEAALLNAAHAAELPLTETIKTIKSGLTDGQKSPRSAPPKPHIVSVPAGDIPEAAPGEAEQTAEQPISFVTLREFLKLDFPPAESLMGQPRGGTNLLPRYGWALPWGPEGCAKTTIGADWMFHGAEGLSWCGYPALRPIRFVVVLNEGVPGGIQDKLAEKVALWEGDADKALDQIAIYTSPWGRFDLSDPRMRNHLRDFAHDFEADYCYLDPLHTMGTIGAGAPKETEQFKGYLLELGLWDTLGVITPHHANRAGMVSGDWGRHPDTLIKLDKPDGRKETRWTIQKARPCDPDEMGAVQRLEWLTETMSFRRSAALDSKAIGANNRQKVLNAAEAGRLLTEIAEEVELSEKTVSEHLKALEEAGKLTLGRGDKNKLVVASVSDDTEAKAA